MERQSFTLPCECEGLERVDLALDLELLVEDEHLDGLSLDAIRGHCFRRRWRIHALHERVQVIGLNADRDLIAFDRREMNGLRDGFTPEEVGVGTETLFPLHEVLNLRYDYHFWHIEFPSLFDVSTNHTTDWKAPDQPEVEGVP